MPVKVTSSTDPEKGQISSQDLSRMKESFINEVDLKGNYGRTTVVKKYSVAVMKDEIKQLLEHYESNGGIDVVNIHLAVHLNPFTTCNGMDYSDSITVVLEAAKFKDIKQTQLGINSFNDQEDLVVIPGYHGFLDTTNASDPSTAIDALDVLPAGTPILKGPAPCCPSSNP